MAAFGAWNAFDRILNEQRSGFPVVCGYDSCCGKHPDAQQQLINKMKDEAYMPFGREEAIDVFTHAAAMDALKKTAPRALYISYGETDEWAHEGHYKDYLNAAHQVDAWVNEIWHYVQSTPQYKNKTLLLISVDHGRGQGKNWTSHNGSIPNSNETWFAIIGPGIIAKGEVKTPVQLFEQQYAQTIARLLGYTFTCEHQVADGFVQYLTR